MELIPGERIFWARIPFLLSFENSRRCDSGYSHSIADQQDHILGSFIWAARSWRDEERHKTTIEFCVNIGKFDQKFLLGENEPVCAVEFYYVNMLVTSQAQAFVIALNWCREITANAGILYNVCTVDFRSSETAPNELYTLKNNLPFPSFLS